MNIEIMLSRLNLFIMAIKKASAQVATEVKREDLTIISRKGVIVLNSVSPKTNSNGKAYIATPFGAVYSRLDKIKPGMHTVVELSNGALALNYSTTEERMAFLNEQKAKYPGFSLEEIKAELGL
jgi:hypothetical protein